MPPETFEGHEILKRLEIPGSTDDVILLTWGAGSDAFQNLIRRRIDGTIAWRAALPTEGIADGYTQVQWKGNELTAGSWSGYDVVIDVTDGRIRSTRFLK